ncbi:MAG: hypothetical protein ACYS74_02010, partial [Planctomycetota bacterium]
DNLRSAVSRSDPYDPEINPEFAEFAEYYDTVILPARVRKARDKALVLCSGYHNPQDSGKSFGGRVSHGVAA